MSKEITNNQLAEKIDGVLYCVRQGFTEQDEKISDIQRQVHINKENIAKNGDEIAQLRKDVVSEFASTISRFERAGI